MNIAELKPSELLRLSLSDLELCEQDPDYDIEMGSWHDPNRCPDYRATTCEVCLAGSVMAQTLNFSIDLEGSPEDFIGETADSLFALNLLRMGRVREAFWYFEGCPTLPHEIVKFTAVPDREVRSYHEDSTKFKSQMNELANELEAAGY